MARRTVWRMYKDETDADIAERLGMTPGQFASALASGRYRVMGPLTSLTTEDRRIVRRGLTRAQRRRARRLLPNILRDRDR